MMEALFYALQLKDAGCSNNADRMAQIMGGDERKAKAGARLADWTTLYNVDRRTSRLLWSTTLPQTGITTRAFRTLKLGLTQQRNNREMITLRCERGAEIVRSLQIGEITAEAVYRLDEHWNGSGYPGSLKQTTIPLLSRICLLVQTLDLFATEDGLVAARRIIRTRSKTWFDPSLVDVVCQLDKEGMLWRACGPGSSSSETKRWLFQENSLSSRALGTKDIDNICKAFADIVDAKSPFTYQHSLRVADAAIALGKEMGLASDRLILLRRAALLHDLGKLGISNSILDKPSNLSEEERASMTKHPALTKMILERIAGFEEIARIAGEHHERLDGSGYPKGLYGNQISVESRILAVADSFATLAEIRPYREAYPCKESFLLFVF